jgi:hypothetical protein
VGQTKGTAARSLADPEVYDLEALNKPQREALVKFWEAWQDELATIRILDPACGSGAFLIEAFDQLHATYQLSNDRLQELRGHRTLFDLDRQILQNNLFGVDLNEEAIQICRLSLWIKTAQRGKTLTSLDHTIRVGNSVVADPEVHPLAFDWEASFPEVMQAGGFDVVVGNPPYIRQEWLAPYKPHWEKRFQSYYGTADIYAYFYELGIEVLRAHGRLGLITSGSWVRGNFGGPLRKFLSSQSKLESLVDFGEFQPFEGAEMIRPSITVFSKAAPEGKAKLFKWLTKGEPPANLSDVLSASDSMTIDTLGRESWQLEADDVEALRQKLTQRGMSLRRYTNGQILYGIKTGLNDVFVIDQETRKQLIEEDESSATVIKPFIQGTHLRPWNIENSTQYLIFTRRGIEIDNYPAIHTYLEQHRERLEPKPKDWSKQNGKWPGRKAGAYKWFEMQDAVDYWEGFEAIKFVLPDISNLPRFSMDYDQRYLGNTGYAIPGEDYFLLGILSSWATWFVISKTAQPLRLRGERWQYRLISQYMEQLPIPTSNTDEREAIAQLAECSNTWGQERYELQNNVRTRLTHTFGEQPDGTLAGKLNNKASAWWELSLNQLGAALKTSFQLKRNPFQNPAVADEWESYLIERQHKIADLTRQLSDAEVELNDRVYRLFDLTADEIKLLQREVEH